jgi:hypothetical protein
MGVSQRLAHDSVKFSLVADGIDRDNVPLAHVCSVSYMTIRKLQKGCWHWWRGPFDPHELTPIGLARHLLIMEDVWSVPVDFHAIRKEASCEASPLR